jgi:hypothetical protein
MIPLILLLTMIPGFGRTGFGRLHPVRHGWQALRSIQWGWIRQIWPGSAERCVLVYDCMTRMNCMDISTIISLWIYLATV